MPQVVLGGAVAARPRRPPQALRRLRIQVQGVAKKYRVFHQLADLGWVNLDWGFSITFQSCVKIKVKPTRIYELMEHPVDHIWSLPVPKMITYKHL